MDHDFNGRERINGSAWIQASRRRRPTSQNILCRGTRGGMTMKTAMLAVLLSMASSAPALAATFVYVSNAEDGDIGMYTLKPDGSLQPGEHFKAEKLVMP